MGKASHKGKSVDKTQPLITSLFASSPKQEQCPMCQKRFWSLELLMLHLFLFHSEHHRPNTAHMHRQRQLTLSSCTSSDIPDSYASSPFPSREQYERENGATDNERFGKFVEKHILPYVERELRRLLCEDVKLKLNDNKYATHDAISVSPGHNLLVEVKATRRSHDNDTMRIGVNKVEPRLILGKRLFFVFFNIKGAWIYEYKSADHPGNAPSLPFTRDSDTKDYLLSTRYMIQFMTTS